MSLTLGEKLRQAREARGITISEVAEQTRISALYLESIENDDYRLLPGGIFNKGFVKSYAKYVGVDDQEAIQDYTKLIASQGEPADESKSYRAEVLTDDQNRSSSIPTIILAVVILAILVGGVLLGLNYYNNNQNAPVANTNANVNKNTNTNVQSNVNTGAPSTVPLTGAVKVEFKVINSEVSLTANSDGKKTFPTITADKSAIFDLNQSLILIYSKDRAANVQLTINGKQINLPNQPANPKRNVIELDITKENVNQIYQSGAITFAPADVNANVAPRR